jgi:hypothetical protein
MANIQAGSPLLWVHLLVAYLVTAAVLRLLWSSSRDVAQLQVRHSLAAAAAAGAAALSAVGELQEGAGAEAGSGSSRSGSKSGSSNLELLDEGTAAAAEQIRPAAAVGEVRLQLGPEAPAGPSASGQTPRPAAAGSPGSVAGGDPPQSLAHLYEAHRLASCTVLVTDLPGVPQGTFSFAAIRALLNNPVLRLLLRRGFRRR